jgi:hypothetical protein
VGFERGYLVRLTHTCPQHPQIPQRRHHCIMLLDVHSGALRRESRLIRRSSKSLQLSLHLLQTRFEGPAHARAHAVPSASHPRNVRRNLHYNGDADASPSPLTTLSAILARTRCSKGHSPWAKLGRPMKEGCARRPARLITRSASPEY